MRLPDGFGHSSIELPAAAREIVAELAEVMGHEREFASRLVKAIEAEVPELLEADDDLQQALLRNGAAYVGTLSSLLRFGIAPTGLEAPSQALEVARMLVHRDIELTVLLRAHHLCEAALWRLWMNLVYERIDDSELLKPLVAWSTAFISGYIDTMARQTTAAFTDEQERWRRSRSATRERAVRQLLDGDSNDDPESLGLRLRYELRRHHVAIILWQRVDGDVIVDPATLEEAVGAIAEDLGCKTGLTLHAAVGVIWAWVSRDSRFDHADLEKAERGDPAGELSAALGEPGFGVAGFRASHQQALQAAKVLRLAPADLHPVVRYRSVSLASALCADPPVARRFAEAELSRIDAEDASGSRLRNTLAVYLAEGERLKPTAARLAVHEKTVSYRVRQIEELLGYPIRTRRVEIEAALLVRSLLNPRDPSG